jgi:hypothetical protein
MKPSQQELPQRLLNITIKLNNAKAKVSVRHGSGFPDRLFRVAQGVNTVLTRARAVKPVRRITLFK